MQMRMNRRTLKTKRGTSLAEAPLALWIILITMAFPLLILVMTSIKFAFFWNAAREAAKAAAATQTFQVNQPSGALSAVNTATNMANLASNAFSGITLMNPVKVFIIRTDLTTNADYKFPTPNVKLSPPDAPPDPEKYYYSIQVVLDGRVEPFLQHPGFQSIGVAIPGLTTSYPIQVSSQFPFENLQGLDD